MKKFLTLAVTICFAMAVNAQTYVQINDTGVNVRKSPSTAAAKMMYDYTEECYECGFSLNFGDAKLQPRFTRDIFNPSTRQPYKLISESDGWSNIMFEDSYGNSVPGWVSSKYVHTLVPAKPSKAEYKQMLQDNLPDNSGMRETGNMAGLLLQCTNPMEGLWSLCAFDDGILFLSNEYEMDVMFKPEIKGVYMHKYDDNRIDLFYGKDRSTTGNEYGALDINKCTEDELVQLFMLMMNGGPFPYIEDYFYNQDNPDDSFYGKYIPNRHLYPMTR